MYRHSGFVNIYASGQFHRVGKANAFNRHPGDIYPTREAAEADIDTSALYVTTVPIEWLEEQRQNANPPDSKPVPLHVTRNRGATHIAGDFLVAM